MTSWFAGQLLPGERTTTTFTIDNPTNNTLTINLESKNISLIKTLLGERGLSFVVLNFFDQEWIERLDLLNIVRVDDITLLTLHLCDFLSFELRVVIPSAVR